jgi:predicted nucleic acid-binding protein
VVFDTTDFLVSGDRDLLSLDGKLICAIVTADQFLNDLIPA